MLDEKSLTTRFHNQEPELPQRIEFANRAPAPRPLGESTRRVAGKQAVRICVLRADPGGHRRVYEECETVALTENAR